MFKDNKDLVYDIYSLHSRHPAAKKRKKDLEELLDVRMGPQEYEYVESQLSCDIDRKDPRKILCFPKKSDIDPIWREQQSKKASLVLYDDSQKQSLVNQVATVSADSVVSDESDIDSDYEEEKEDTSSKKKRKYKKILENNLDTLPKEYQHVRSGKGRFWISLILMLVR